MTYQQQERSVNLTIENQNTPYTSQDLALTIAQGADDKKGTDILLLNVAQVSYLADYFVIITGFSRTQVRAIYNSIEAKVEETYGKSPLRIEGQSEGTWILLDYGDVIVHIMLPEERDFYKIEAFWGHAEQIWFETISL
jgi:ribosome-associated protein